MGRRLSKSFHPAYHLRPNKAVDRFLFMELLKALDARCSLRSHTYIGLGGPYLEDFRLFAHDFPAMHLISIEKDHQTHLRQKFHQCSANMDFFPGTMGEFLQDRFPSATPVVVWADYTDVSRECMSELSDIVRQAVPSSVLRITVRAETPVPEQLRIADNFRYPPQVPRGKKSGFEKIRDQYQRGMAIEGIVFPGKWFDWNEFSVDQFPAMLDRMIRHVAEGSCVPPKAFLPLHSVKYSDGTIMLSVTGIICMEEEKADLVQHFRDRTPTCGGTPDSLETIDVPALTARERLHLERLLPTERPDGAVSMKGLSYLIEGDESEVESMAKMAQYERYHGLYPLFGRVVP
jgi:hypothetical protein